MVDITSPIKYQFEGNGDTILMDNYGDTDFTKGIGRNGFGVAPTTVNMLDGAGPGSRFRNSVRNARSLLFPIYIFGDNANEIETKMRRLVRLWNDDFGNAIIRASYGDGTSWTTEIHYASGADVTFGTDTNGRTYAEWRITFTCPDPYWTSDDAKSFSLRAGNAGRGLIRTGGGGLSRLRVSSSQAIGALQVENDGDVPAQPVWAIQGPGTGFTATRAIDGASFALPITFASTDIITVDTVTGKVTDQTGANRYAALGTAPKLFSIPVGVNEIDASLIGATSASLITMYFLEKRELVFG